MKRTSLVLIFTLLLPVGAAMASHYPLEAVSFVSPEEVKVLTKRGIEDTEQLLASTATAMARSDLAGVTGLDKKRLRELQEFCDLLQIRGVGPKMAAVLRLAGVYDTRTMAAEDAVALATKMKKANDIHKVSEILPEPAVLQGWIEQAAAFSRSSR